MPPIVQSLLLALILPAGLSAQTLEQRLAGMSGGTLRLSFAARPGVCGDGANNVSTRQVDQDWEVECEAQPVRVALRISERRVTAVRTYVGGRWRASTAARDIGVVRPQDAAAYFLALAAREIELEGDPVLPATLADSVRSGPRCSSWPAIGACPRRGVVPPSSG